MLINQVVISIQLPLGLSRLHARGHADWSEVKRTRANKITQNTALHLKHVLGLNEIMTQYANTIFT